MLETRDDKVASFILKLHGMLKVHLVHSQSSSNSNLIYWDNDQKGIRVTNQKKLQEQILPKYFRHNRFSSFVRQLNMYGFHKIHIGDGKSIFCHPLFDPRKKNELHLFKRRDAKDIPEDVPNVSLIAQPVPSLSFYSSSGQLPSMGSRKQSSQSAQRASNGYLKGISQQLVEDSKLLRDGRPVSIPLVPSVSRSFTRTAQPKNKLDQTIEFAINSIGAVCNSVEELEEHLKRLCRDRSMRHILKLSSVRQKIYNHYGLTEPKGDEDEMSLEQLQDGMGSQWRLTQKSMKLVSGVSGVLPRPGSFNFGSDCLMDPNL